MQREGNAWLWRGRRGREEGLSQNRAFLHFRASVCMYVAFKHVYLSMYACRSVRVCCVSTKGGGRSYVMRVR